LVNSGVKKVIITIVDYNKFSILTNTSNIYINYVEDFTSVTNKKYNLVLASAIIEHLTNPSKIILRLFSYLQNDGIFYARTPYILSFFRFVKFFKFNFDFTYPGHIHDLGENFWNNIFNWLPVDNKNNYKIIKTNPSIVETSFNKHFFRTLAAYIFKFPWYIFGSVYKMVGGWEIFIKRNRNKHNNI